MLQSQEMAGLAAELESTQLQNEVLESKVKKEILQKQLTELQQGLQEQQQPVGAVAKTGARGSPPPVSAKPVKHKARSPPLSPRAEGTIDMSHPGGVNTLKISYINKTQQPVTPEMFKPPPSPTEPQKPKGVSFSDDVQTIPEGKFKGKKPSQEAPSPEPTSSTVSEKESPEAPEKEKKPSVSESTAEDKSDPEPDKREEEEEDEEKPKDTEADSEGDKSKSGERKVRGIKWPPPPEPVKKLALKPPGRLDVEENVQIIVPNPPKKDKPPRSVPPKVNQL